MFIRPLNSCSHEKNTSQKLTKQIAQYGALSLAIGGFTEANGQIMYHDVDPDEGGVWVTAFIDFNQDGQWDFTITEYYDPPLGYLAVGRNAQDEIIGSRVPLWFGSGGIAYPFALYQGALISAGNEDWTIPYSGGIFFALNFGYCSFTNSHWCGVNDKYLGMRFKIGADTHYGLARLDVTNSSVWKLKDYAYNSIPDASINAGQLPLGLDDSILSKIKIVARNNRIELHNLNDATNYRLFSLTGQEVLKGTTDSHDYVMEANTVASGIYIVELADTKSNALMRKKIVL